MNVALGAERCAAPVKSYVSLSIYVHILGGHQGRLESMFDGTPLFKRHDEVDNNTNNNNNNRFFDPLA